MEGKRLKQRGVMRERDRQTDRRGNDKILKSDKYIKREIEVNAESDKI